MTTYESFQALISGHFFIAFKKAMTKSGWVIPKVVAVAYESFQSESIVTFKTGLYMGGCN